MSKTILVDFDTSKGRDFEKQRPIGVLLERVGRPGFDSQYLESITEDSDDGHDNYVRTTQVVDEFRLRWDKGDELKGMTSVRQLFTYLADQSYLGLRLRSLGDVDDGVTLAEAFDLYVVQALPLVAANDEEFPVDV